MPLSEKIDRAIQLIRLWEGHALDLSPDGFYVAFSGGKDSIVLERLFSMAGVKYQAWYNNPTIDVGGKSVSDSENRLKRRSMHSSSPSHSWGTSRS